MDELKTNCEVKVTICMNVSLVCLSVGKLLVSPFLNVAGYSSVYTLSGYRMRMERYSVPFLRSQNLMNLHLKDSHFSNFLHSPIHLSLKHKLVENKRLTKRVKTDKGILVVNRCVFENCSTSNKGGAVFAEHCDVVQLTNCVFATNSGRYSGAVAIQDAKEVEISRTCVVNNAAEFIGGMYCDGKAENKVQFCSIRDTNFSSNTANKWTGAIRIDHGSFSISACVFSSNTAQTCGACFDFSWEPSQSTIHTTQFLNNSAYSRGGAFCAFHMMHHSTFDSCVFYGNRCNSSGNSIHIESTDSEVRLTSCVFEKEQTQELAMRFDGSHFVVDNTCIFSADTYPKLMIESPDIENLFSPVSGASNEQPV